MGCGQSITAPLYCSFLLTLFLCSTMGPYHGLQSFRINLLHHGLSTGCSSFKEYPPTLAWSSMGCNVDIWSTAVLSVGSRETAAPWTSLPWASALVPGVPLLLLCLSAWCSQGCFSHFFSLVLTACSPFCPLLNPLL